MPPETQQGQLPQDSSNQNPQNTYIATDGSRLNPTAVLLAKSIRKVESNHDYNAVGDNGESHGAYQFNKDNFNTWAQQYGLNPNDMSPVNQDRVAYTRINDLLEKGLKPSEVAAIWNGAKATSTGYQAINPQYVEKVKSAYTDYYNESRGYITEPTLSKPTGKPVEPTQPGIGQELVHRGQDIGSAISRSVSGEISPISGVLQVGGAIGGAIGDIVGKGLELIPGVKDIENLISEGVGRLSQTSVGQSVVKEINNFRETHPELADDIGAGFNIVTAIPILRGLGAVGKLATTGIAKSLEGFAEKGITKDLTEVLSRTVKGRDFLAKEGDSFVKDAVVGERLLPEIQGGRYITDGVVSDIKSRLSALETQQLEPALRKITQSGASPVVSIDQVRNDAIRSARQALEGTQAEEVVINKINKLFDRAANSSKTILSNGEPYLKLEDANFFKRQARKGVSMFDFGSKDAGTYVGHAYMKSIEDIAIQNGFGDVAAINQKMAQLIRARDVLAAINGKPVKMGFLGKGIHEGLAGAATIAGETVGGATGVPFAGALAGRGAGNYAARLAEKKLGGGILKRAILKRTVPGALKEATKIATQKAKGLIGSTIAQNQLSR